MSGILRASERGRPRSRALRRLPWLAWFLFVPVAPTTACKPDRLPGEGVAPVLAAGDGVARGTIGALGEDPVLVEVAGEPITLADVERSTELLSTTAELRVGHDGARPRLLTTLVQLRLLASEAARQGSIGAPEAWILREDARARAWLERTATFGFDPGQVAEDLVTGEFELRRREFRGPERRRVSTLVLDDEARAIALREEIAEALAQSRGSPRERFGEFVRLYSVDPATREREGDIGFVGAGGHGYEPDPAIAEAVFGLTDLFELAGPVRTARGWELLLWTDFYAERGFTRELVAEFLRHEIWRRQVAERAEGVLDDLRADAPVEVDAALLSRLEAADRGAPIESGMTEGTDIASRVVGARAVRPRRYERSGLERGEAMLLGYDAVAREPIPGIEAPMSALAAPRGSGDDAAAGAGDGSPGSGVEAVEARQGP